ncbi:MAG TPA: hypothetical protein ENN28_01130 [Candidatus Uhrbacteria bacterium]|nr:hypothetical protein [Candidatus Uhrbacteria bacterium]
MVKNQKEGKMLGDVRKNEKFFQLAIISQDELENGKIVLMVNDDNGQLNNRIVMDWREFQKEFYSHPKTEGYYLRQVMVEEISGNQIFYVRLDAKDRPCSSTRIVQKEIFLKTYLFPDQAGLI